MKILLLRHGRTEANEKHLYCGSTDLPLSPEGRAELERLWLLFALPELDDWQLVTSGMTRCEETLAAYLGPVPHRTEPRFREMDFGIFEMHSYEELKDTPEYQAWLTGDNEQNVAPGGESGAIMTARVLAAWQDLVKTGRNALVVTHGGPIAAIMAHLFPAEGKNRYQWQPGAGRGYLVDTEKPGYEII